MQSLHSAMMTMVTSQSRVDMLIITTNIQRKQNLPSFNHQRAYSTSPSPFLLHISLNHTWTSAWQRAIEMRHVQICETDFTQFLYWHHHRHHHLCRLRIFFLALLQLNSVKLMMVFHICSQCDVVLSAISLELSSSTPFLADWSSLSSSSTFSSFISIQR